MIHIELYITMNDSGEAYKCDISEHKKHWKCTLYKEGFHYEILKDCNLSNCMEKIAQHLDTMGQVNKIEGNAAAEMYIAILNTHLMIMKSRRGLQSRQG
jgi:hypothetical protein